MSSNTETYLFFVGPAEHWEGMCFCVEDPLVEWNQVFVREQKV